MRTNKTLLTALFSLAFATWANSAYASCYANFAGNCNRSSSSGPAYCVFDSKRTYDNGGTRDLTPTNCGSSVISQVTWELNYPGTAPGDSASGRFVGHAYLDPAALGNDAVIRMTLRCADGCVATKDRYLIFLALDPSDMYCNAGWN